MVAVWEALVFEEAMSVSPFWPCRAGWYGCAWTEVDRGLDDRNANWNGNEFLFLWMAKRTVSRSAAR